MEKSEGWFVFDSSFCRNFLLFWKRRLADLIKKSKGDNRHTDRERKEAAREEKRSTSKGERYEAKWLWNLGKIWTRSGCTEVLLLVKIIYVVQMVLSTWNLERREFVLNILRYWYVLSNRLANVQLKVSTDHQIRQLIGINIMTDVREAEDKVLGECIVFCLYSQLEIRQYSFVGINWSVIAIVE